MQIHWRNIIAAILAILILIGLVNCWPQITAALTSVRNISPGHTTEDKMTGLIMIGLIGAVLVAIVRILTSQGK
jgi:hypothetical protein